MQRKSVRIRPNRDRADQFPEEKSERSGYRKERRWQGSQSADKEEPTAKADDKRG